MRGRRIAQHRHLCLEVPLCGGDSVLLCDLGPRRAADAALPVLLLEMGHGGGLVHGACLRAAADAPHAQRSRARPRARACPCPRAPRWPLTRRARCLAPPCVQTGAALNTMSNLETTSVSALLFFYVAPLWALVMGVLLIGEALPRRTVVAVGVALAGVCLLFVPSVLAGGDDGACLLYTSPSPRDS